MSIGYSRNSKIPNIPEKRQIPVAVFAAFLEYGISGIN
jgi:hypothetical protein